MERGIPIPPRMAQPKKITRQVPESQYTDGKRRLTKVLLPHANASEYHLNEGDSFSFQIVINRRDYHQLMNRRRIKKLDAQVKLKKILTETTRAEKAAAASRFGGVLTPDEDADNIPFAFRRSPREIHFQLGHMLSQATKLGKCTGNFQKKNGLGISIEASVRFEDDVQKTKNARHSTHSNTYRVIHFLHIQHHIIFKLQLSL